MKKLFIFFTMLVSLIFISIAGAVEIEIIYASKMPEIEHGKKGVGGLAELSSLVKQTRETSENFLFLHGGDSLAPSTMSSFDRGIHMIDILNSMEPDALAVNEREFAFKEDELTLRISESAFPFISSNIHDPYTNGNLQGVEDSLCYSFGKYKVCIIALLDPIVLESYLPDRIKVDRNLKNIEKKANALRDDGADLVILMASHASENLKQMISVGIIDLVFYAASDEDAVYPVENGLFLKQGTGKGNAIKVNIFLEEEKGALKARYNASVVPLIEYSPDPDVVKKIQYYTAKLSKILGVVLGQTKIKLDSRKEMVRTKETTVGNLLTDGLRNYYGADIAFINGGSIRGNRTYDSGTKLTRKDILRELPFRNEGMFVMVKGKDIVSALENGFSLYEKVKGRFLQVSGLKVNFCPDSSVGKRIKSVWVNGDPIDLNREYSLATSDYLISGGDGFEMLKQSRPIHSKKVNLLLWEIARSYIEKKNYVSPQIEGRIAIVCDN